MPIWHRWVISAADHPLRQIGQIGRVLRSPSRACARLDGNKMVSFFEVSVWLNVETAKSPRENYEGGFRTVGFAASEGGKKHVSLCPNH
jgi:hypothetical protein